MKYPLNKKEFETAVNSAYKKKGYWVHHMDTTIPGFPDTLVAKWASFHIEYKYFVPGDEHRRMLDFFESTQPGQMIFMSTHGMKVKIVIYCGGLVYWVDVTQEVIQNLTKMNMRDFFSTCNQVYYSVFIENIK